MPEVVGPDAKGPVPVDHELTVHGARRLVALALACVVLLGVLYVLAVRTGWGQRLDDAALDGRTTRASVQRATDRLLDSISISSLALVGSAVMAIALVRWRLHLALTAGAVILGANVTSQVLKRDWLARPDLFGQADPLGSTPSFPSGHATVAMSLAVALVLVVPMRWRSMAALGGLTYAGLVGGGVVTAGWHRPSDVIGAYLVAVGWGAGAAAVLILWRGVARESRVLRAPVVNSLLAGAGLGLLLVGFIGFAATLVALRQDQLDAVDLGGSYVAALVSILGANVLLVLALVTSLRGVGLDPPGAAEPTSPVDDHALFKGGRRRPIPEM